jgi:hypothetical protein
MLDQTDPTRPEDNPASPKHRGDDPTGWRSLRFIFFMFILPALLLVLLGWLRK